MVNTSSGQSVEVFASMVAAGTSSGYASSALSAMGAAISAARGAVPLCVSLPGDELIVVKDSKYWWMRVCAAGADTPC